MNLLRFKTKNFYDLQKLRIQSGNRDKWKDKDDIQLSDEDIEYFSAMADNLNHAENIAKDEIFREVHNTRLWKEFLKGVSGCGETMSAVLMSEIDIVRATTVSKILAVCGLGIEKEWEIEYQDVITHEKKDYIQPVKKQVVWGTSEESAKNCTPRPKKFKNKFIEKGDLQRKVNYCNRISDKTEIQKLRKDEMPSYNKFLKTKVLGVMVDCFMRAKNNQYKTFYYDYKQRKEPKGLKKGHLDRQAKRYMIKMFMKDLYANWRAIEGLPVRQPYEEEYLNKKHSG